MRGLGNVFSTPARHQIYAAPEPTYGNPQGDLRDPRNLPIYYYSDQLGNPNTVLTDRASHYNNYLGQVVRALPMHRINTSDLQSIHMSPQEMLRRVGNVSRIYDTHQFARNVVAASTAPVTPQPITPMQVYHIERRGSGGKKHKKSKKKSKSDKQSK